MENVIEVDNLEFHYGQNLIFSHVNFIVKKSDFVSLIGANGSGKSTLLNLLLGEKNPSSGKIKLFNVDIEDFKDWPRIGYVPQTGFGLSKDFPASCEEIVRTNLFPEIGLFKLGNKKHRDKVLEALKLVNMQDYAKRLIGELSGGQIQRVMIARVLVNNPDIMILDEPTTGIDAETVKLLYELLWQLNKEKNITIVMVTHDTPNTIDYANRIMCLEEGSLLELNKMDLKKELAHRHTHPELSNLTKRRN